MTMISITSSAFCRLLITGFLAAGGSTGIEPVFTSSDICFLQKIRFYSAQRP